MQDTTLEGPRRPLTFTIGITGEHFEYLTSARSGDGKFRFRWTLAPGKKGPPEHVHSDETETFEVVSGVLQIWLDDVMTELRPGMPPLTAPPRARHRFKNPGTEPTIVNVTFDGTRNEDAHVPVAVHFAGRSIGPTDLARLFVHDAEVGATLASWEPFNALQRAFARVMKVLGVKPFPIVESW